MTSDEEIQEEILGELCELFEEKPGNLDLDGQSVVENVKDSLGVDENEVVYNIKRLNDNFVIDHTQTIGGVGMISLEVRGIEKYEELSENNVVPSKDIRRVINLLYKNERDSPQSPALSRDELLDETDLSENSLDRVIWYIKEKGWADVLTHIGTPWYANAKITAAGRSIHESMQ